MTQTESQTQPQQSWAAWILDAYANSVVPSHDDLCDDSLYDFTAEPVEMANNTSTSTSTSSAYGPYVRTGRGGAGNFTWQSQQPIDPEIQAPKSLKEKRKIALTIEHIDTTTAVNRSQLSSRSFTFPRVGRGGAGNITYSQSNEIQHTPTSATFARSPSATSSPIMYTGRGGAGNFVAANSTNELARQAKEKQEQAEAERRREEAEQQVSSLLRAPTQAYTGSSRRSTMPEEFESWA